VAVLDHGRDLLRDVSIEVAERVQHDLGAIGSIHRHAYADRRCTGRRKRMQGISREHLRAFDLCIRRRVLGRDPDGGDVVEELTDAGREVGAAQAELEAVADETGLQLVARWAEHDTVGQLGHVDIAELHEHGVRDVDGHQRRGHAWDTREVGVGLERNVGRWLDDEREPTVRVALAVVTSRGQAGEHLDTRQRLFAGIDQATAQARPFDVAPVLVLTLASCEREDEDCEERAGQHDQRITPPAALRPPAASQPGRTREPRSE
jgi:hypothetical protein